MRLLALLVALGGCDRLFLLTQVDPLPGRDSGRVDTPVFTGDAPTCAGMFAPPMLVPAGQGPATVAVGDVSGDGIRDLVVANSAESSITVSLGMGQRRFGPGIRLDAVDGIDDLRLVDENGDTKLDIVDVGGTSGILEVHYGDAGGRFEPGQGAPSGTDIRGMFVGYLNADPYPDIAVASFGDTDEKVWFAAASGTLQSTYAIATEKIGAVSVDGADIDQDGDLDLVFANHEEDKVYIARNVGNSTFQGVTAHDTRNGPNWVTLVDLTNDGFPEVVTADMSSGAITVALNDGMGHFLTITSASSTPVSAMPWAVAHADFNLDGNQDLVVSNAADATVTVLFGNGTGSFPTAKTYGVGMTPHGVVTTDADGDGLADIEVANFGGSSVSVLFNCPN